MKLSLKLKISIIMIIIISLPLSISGMMSYNMASQSLQQEIETQLKNTTGAAANSIDVALEDATRYLQIASKNDTLAKLTVNPADESIRTSAYQYISSFQKDNAAQFESLIIADKEGSAMVTNESDTPDINVKDREYFQTALQGKEAISEVILSKVTNKHVIAIAYPLVNNGNTTGVLIGTIIFDTISEAAVKIKVGETGYAYMIDRQGLIVSHPVKDKILKESLDGNSNKELNSFVQEMKAGKTSNGFYTYEGIYKYMSFQPAGNWVVVTTANYKEYMAPAMEIRSRTLLLTIVCILGSVLIGYFLTLVGITNPIQKLKKAMAMAGNGDLTVHTSIRSRDELQELSDSFNTMIDKQEAVIEKIRSNSGLLTSMSQEMAASSEQISASIQEISSSTEEIAAGAENSNLSIVNASQVLLQLSSLIHLAQNKADATFLNANATNEAAQAGRTKVINTVEAMDTISISTSETSSILESINEMTDQVSTIIGTINALAGQTNLLALNAAIEAARAGEQGRGFSVVAGEVRKLSDESHLRANEISELVESMIAKIQMAVVSMKGAFEAVTEGVKIVHETDRSFIHIIESMESITGNVKEIVDIAKAEVATSEQIVQLIDSLGNTSETAAANSESVSSAVGEQAATVNNLAASAEEVSAMASELENLVENFKIKE
ncbi:methyl-accepting chemotaxis protein [Paenibacillus wynnii]|uniref:methyl-accepting chemotaxis protein n=1 Tax=Paenibacillus wynnii TaxID=268407 RepID=UPI0027D8BAA0|nr:methyl-accepting chemotaxis protein [Paenibacillus wynnii]